MALDPYISFTDLGCTFYNVVACASFFSVVNFWSNSSLQVAERALYLWSNDHIENLIKQNRKVILPIILPALEENCNTHWNQAVQSLTLNVRKTFSDADPELFEECLRKFMEDEAKQQELKAKQEASWRRLEEIVATKTSSPQKTAAQTGES